MKKLMVAVGLLGSMNVYASTVFCAASCEYETQGVHFYSRVVSSNGNTFKEAFDGIVAKCNNLSISGIGTLYTNGNKGYVAGGFELAKACVSEN